MPEKCKITGEAVYQAISSRRLPGERDYALSKRIGVQSTTLDGWKLGRRPRLDNLVRIAEALGMNAGDLLNECVGIERQLRNGCKRGDIR